MPPNIFLSYSRRDIEVMHRLRDDLRAEGFTVWTDEGIEPGTPSWKSEIEKAIRECDCLVIIFSPDSSSSRWVRAEIDFAETLHKPMFPLLARGDETTSIPFGFSTYQWIDIRKSSDYDSGFRLLADAVRHRLNRPQDAPPLPSRQREQTVSRPASRRGLWVAGAVVLIGLVLAALLLPNIPASLAPATQDAGATQAASASLTASSLPTQTQRPIPTSELLADCKMLSEAPVYERVDPPTLPIPDGWVQLASDRVTIAIPDNYYQTSDTNLLSTIFPSILVNVVPGFTEVACEWNLEIFFLQIAGLRGGGVVSRRIGIPMSLEAQQLYYEEAFKDDAVVETEIVSLPAGDAVRIEMTLGTTGDDAKIIGYSISHGSVLYALSFAFPPDAVNESLELVEQVAQTLRFLDEE